MKDLIPVQLLRQYSQEFPQAWRQIASMREDRGRALPWWPDWCYCPISGAVAIVTEGAPNMGIKELHKLSEHPPALLLALAAWRVTKGIYRFDPTLREDIANMPLEGDLPVEVFYSLPEWSIYIETPGMSYLGEERAGMFVSLEYDAGDNRHELRLTFIDHALQCIPVAVHLGNWSIQEAIERFFKEANYWRKQQGLAPLEGKEYDHVFGGTVSSIMPFINLVLYICSVSADFGDAGRPQHPREKPRRKGKIQTADKLRIWDIGVREGAALRRTEPAPSYPSEGEESSNVSPRPHYRRAHWHHYWTGPQNDPEKRQLIVKWLPPIPVGFNMEDDSSEIIPAVIRAIRPDQNE